MPLLERGRSSIWWEEQGSGPPLLLVMGLALSSRAWDRLPALLAPGFRVLTFDNRGTGRSSRTGGLYRMRDLADDAAAVIEASGAGRAHVFGISMGGMIAQELALRHPDRVDRLALGCTFSSWLRSARPRLRTALALLLLHLGRVTARRVAQVVVSDEWELAHPGAALEWITRADRTSLRYALAQFAGIAAHGTTKRLAQIRAPTLVLAGDADRLVPLRNSEALAAAIPGARLHVLHGAGHAFPLEREQETVSVLRQFFGA